MPAPAPTRRFGHLIRMARQEQGLSQSKLGALLGTNQSSVSAWEGGGVLPRLEVILQACKVLDIDPHALLDACEDDLSASLTKLIARNEKQSKKKKA